MSEQLQRLQFAGTQHIRGEFVQDAELDIVQDLVGDLTLRLTQSVWSNPLGRIVYEFPATAWQHVKRDYAPAWFTRRYPVRYRYDVRSAAAIFPAANIATPAELGRLVYHTSPDHG